MVGFSDKETEKKQGYLNNFTLVRDKLKYYIFGDLWTEKVSRCQKLLYMRLCMLTSQDKNMFMMDLLKIL